MTINFIYSLIVVKFQYFLQYDLGEVVGRGTHSRHRFIVKR